MSEDSPRPTVLVEADLAALRDAKRRLENPSLTAKISALLGRQLETGFAMLPARVRQIVGSGTETALFKGLTFAVKTMGQPEPSKSRDWLHKALAAGTGAAGGAFGVVALPIELPVSTCLMLRSIADIARSEGHDISLLEVRLACLEAYSESGASEQASLTSSEECRCPSLRAMSAMERSMGGETGGSIGRATFPRKRRRPLPCPRPGPCAPVPDFDGSGCPMVLTAKVSPLKSAVSVPNPTIWRTLAGGVANPVSSCLPSNAENLGRQTRVLESSLGVAQRGQIRLDEHGGSRTVFTHSDTRPS